jgi:predicted nucleotidyltransferase
VTDSTFLDFIVRHLSPVPGIQAVVLGGSRALGTHTPDSDTDLGLYYHSSAPPDLEALQHAVAEIDDRQGAYAITPIGEWGPWINGGGWLKVQGRSVDLLYRDLARVAEVVADCRAGCIAIHYQPGHPHGFATPIYMGEVATCKDLWDPHGEVARLKEHTRPYSPLLQRAIVDKFLWEAQFSIDNARKGVSRADVAYVGGCCFRSVACLIQVLFALNERYLLNEKGSLAVASTLAIRPANLKPRVEAVFELLDAEAAAIEAAVAQLETIADEVAVLAARQTETSELPEGDVDHPNRRDRGAVM